MVINKKGYAYKHFVFKIENPNINKFLIDIEQMKYQAYNPDVYKHAKMAEMVTTENGYTIIIFEYDDNFVDTENIITKFKEYTEIKTKKLVDLYCSRCHGKMIWTKSNNCTNCYTSEGEKTF